MLKTHVAASFCAIAFLPITFVAVETSAAATENGQPRLSLAETAASFPLRMIHFNVKVSPGAAVEESARYKAMEEAIRIAGRYKYTHVIFNNKAHSWVLPELPFMSQPASEDASYDRPSQEDLQALIEFSRSQGLKAVPQYHAWGKIGFGWIGTRNPIVAHRPELEELFVGDRPRFNLRDDRIYSELLFPMFDALIRLFDQPDYFHIGMDEVKDYGEFDWETPELLARHVNRINRYFQRRNIKVMMWGDMFLPAEDPRFQNFNAAHSAAPGYTHRSLPGIAPDNLIITDWHYDGGRRYPSVDYFQEQGFNVIACPWNSHKNIHGFYHYGYEKGVAGGMVTTWNQIREMVDFKNSIQVGGVVGLHPDIADLETLYSRFPRLRMKDVLRAESRDGRLITLAQGERFSETFENTDVFHDARVDELGVVYRWTYGSAFSSAKAGEPASAIYRFQAGEGTKLVLRATDRGRKSRQSKIFVKRDGGEWEELRRWQDTSNRHVRRLAPTAILPESEDGTVLVKLQVTSLKDEGRSGGLSKLIVEAR